VDVAGLAETNSPWQLQHIKSEFLKRAKKYSTISKTVFGSVHPSIDPVSSTDKFQAGGCITMIQGNWTTAVQRDEINDPSGLGRWAGFTLSGKNKSALSIISAYRTCKGSIRSSGVNTTYHREYVFYRDRGIKSPNPRKAFFSELEKIIQLLHQQGNAVVLMFDANEVLQSSGDFAGFLGRLDLYDIHHHNFAPSTYIGSSNRRIDYILASSKLRDFIKATGTLSYVDGPQSDHRGLFFDVHLAGYLSYNPNDNKHAPAYTRALRTGNPELVLSYTTSMLQYYASHSMEKRIDLLYRTFTTMSQSDIREALESWDRDQGRAMKQAEKTLQLPHKSYAWSPQLRNAGIIKRYWRLRL
jgi:hypothetical protein